MLVLSHTDTFRVYLNQLCQRILQSASKGHGTSCSNIKVRIFLCSQLGSRIYRSPRLVYDCILNVVAFFFNKVSHNLFRFSRCGAVSYYNNICVILLYDFLEHSFCTLDVVFRLCRIYGSVGLQFARLVENCHLAAGSVSRVDGDNALAFYRRRHQKAFCIFGKNLYSLSFGPLSEKISHFSFYRRCHKSLIGISDSVLKKSEENILFVLYYAACDYAVHLLSFYNNLYLQLLFLFPSVNGQNSVVRNFGKCLLVVVVHLVNCLFFRICGFRCDNRFCEGLFSDVLSDFCVIGNHFRDYIAGSLKSISCSIYFLFRVDERLCSFFRRAVGLQLCKNNHCQRL